MTLYAVRLPPEAESLDEAEVLDESKYGWSFLEQAVMLWRLVDIARAEQIDAIMERVARDAAARDRQIRIEVADLSELVRLLTGIEEAIVGAGIVDSHWRVSAERLEDLARQVPAMDLKTERSLDDKTDALGEVMSNAIFVRNFLSDALKASSTVVLA